MEEPNVVKKSSKSNIILIIVIVVIIGLVIFTLAQSKKKGSVLNNSNATPQKEVNGKVNENTVVDTNLKTFNVEASNFVFSSKEIKVQEGDRVVINFTNKEGFHDFVLDEFKVKTSQLEAGKTERIEFTANKKGTFEYYCSVSTHRQLGMKGNFIVE